MSVSVRPKGVAHEEAADRRSRLPRFSLGHLAVALAAILAFVANVAFLRSLDKSVTVAVAARPILAGETVEAVDLTTTRIRADDDVIGSLVTDGDSVAGGVARRDLAEGELVGSADLLAVPALGLRSMALPIEAAHAAGGAIRVGDRVDLVDVGDDGAARYVVRAVPVLAVSEQAAGALAVSAARHIVVGLDENDVLAVAEAIADGEVDVIVATGASGG